MIYAKEVKAFIAQIERRSTSVPLLDKYAEDGVKIYKKEYKG